MPKEKKTNPLLWIGLGGGALAGFLLCCCGSIGGYYFFGGKAGLPGSAPSFAGKWEDKVGTKENHIVYHYEFGAFGKGTFKEFEVTHSKRGPAKVTANFDYKILPGNPRTIELKFTSIDRPMPS